MLGNVTDYRCIIQPRGGGAALGEIPVEAVTGISWDRKLDEFSSAQVDLSTGSCNCSVLELADPLATELLLVRDTVPVWVGPIISWELGRESGFVQAQDLSAWLNWRVIHSDIVSEETNPANLGVIAREIIEDALLPDNPNIIWSVQDSMQTGARKVLSKEYRNALQELEEILRTDLDMVVVGRVIYVYQTETPQPTLPELNDAHFIGDVRLVRDGSLMATRVIVNGENDLWAVYPAEDAGSVRYGLKEKVFNETSIRDQASLDLAAKTRYDFLKNPVTRVTIPSGSRLSPETPIDINDLVPGFRQKVTLTSLCFPISAMFRLQSVSVDVGPDGEEVKVDYIPVGTVLE